MNQRYVSGIDNGKTYSFPEAGNMTLAGKITSDSKDAGALANPNKVTIRVKKDQFGTDPTVCIVDKTPSKTPNQQTSFTVGCGNETSGKYYIEASKVNDDGWNILSSGTIKISN